MGRRINREKSGDIVCIEGSMQRIWDLAVCLSSEWNDDGVDWSWLKSIV